jgi:hypothetical protein
MASCAAQMCSTDEFCIAYRTVGGAVTMPDSNGNCPGRTHVEGMYCLSDPLIPQPIFREA